MFISYPLLTTPLIRLACNQGRRNRRGGTGSNYKLYINMIFQNSRKLEKRIFLK